MSIGYGPPPSDPARLRDIAELYRVDVSALHRLAANHPSPTRFTSAAKAHLEFSARLIGRYIEHVQKESELRLLYDNAPMPYQSLDCNGHFLEVNRTWLETMGGYSREEIIGKSFGDFLLPEWKELCLSG